MATPVEEIFYIMKDLEEDEIKEFQEGFEDVCKKNDLLKNLLIDPFYIWKKFPDINPEDSGTYEIVIENKHGRYVDVAEYSAAQNKFLWYSRHGYPYELKDVTHWKELSQLTLTEGDSKDDTIS